MEACTASLYSADGLVQLLEKGKIFNRFTIAVSPWYPPVNCSALHTEWLLVIKYDDYFLRVAKRL